MKKKAFIFPGQGAQKVGMGQDFYEGFEESREVFDWASENLKMDMKALCFEENDRLNITRYTQPGLLAAEIAMLKVIEAKGIVPAVTAGLSLGEYGALVAAKKMFWKDALRVIERRGLYMQEAVPAGGAMSAVMGLDFEKVEEICRNTDGIVELANYNCPGQIVISGEAEAVENAGAAMKAAGAKRVAVLEVSGPFHSSMLKGAGEQLKPVLSDVEWLESDIPYVSNTIAEPVTDSSIIEGLLVRQVSESVRWQQSVEKMIGMGVEVFVEIGPGKTLTGFLKRIDRKIPCIHIENTEDLKKLEELVC